ncbi:MAG: helix-turn-helix domain-containing protein, partial [Prosthecobacter sp.]
KGSPHLVVVSKIPLRDAKGRVIGVAGVSRRIEQLRSAPDSAKRLAAAINHLHQNSSEPLSTELLAQMAGMSVSQFERVFRKTLGTSPRQYLLQVRITKAARLIAETDSSIALIALECGFYDHAHFTRVFRQQTGRTPVAHRKRSRGKI